MVFLFIWTAVFVLYLAITDRQWQRPAGRIAGSLVIFVVLASPVLVPMLVRARSEGRVSNPAFDVRRFSTDLAAFVVPSPLSALGRTLPADVHETIIRRDSNIEIVTYLGLIALILAVVGCRVRLVPTGFWLLSFALFLSLTLGPVPHVMGRAMPIFSALMPYNLLSVLPYGDIPRVPSRYVVMAFISMSVLAACGAARVIRSRSRAVATLTVAGVVGLIVMENTVVPLPITTGNVPPYLKSLAKEDGKLALLEVPIPDDPATFPVRMLYQTVHGRPIFGGYISRGLPPLDFAAVPGFAQFKSLSNVVDDVIPYDPATLGTVSRAVLAAYSTGLVIIEKNLMTRDDVSRARAVGDALLGPSAQVYDDVRTLVYRPEPPDTSPLCVWLDTGWSYLERAETSDSDGRNRRWRWMSDRARIGVTAPGPRQARLRLSAQAFAQTRRVRIMFNGAEVVTLVVTTERATYQTPVFVIDHGVGFLDVESLDGAQSPGIDQRRLSVAVFRLDLESIP